MERSIKANIKQGLRAILREHHSKRKVTGTNKWIHFKSKDHLNLFIQREIDYEYVRLLKQYIQMGDRIFDIGSNIGQFAIPLSEYAGEEGSIHCFEPDIEAFSYLQKNISLNGCHNVSASNLAVGEVNEEKTIYLDTQTGGRKNSLHREEVGDNYDGSKKIISCITLDSLIAKHGVPNLIKIDVEGYEMQVLSGLSNIPSSTIFAIELRNECKDRIIARFIKSGFKAYKIFKHKLVPIEEVKELNAGLADYLFVPNNGK